MTGVFLQARINSQRLPRKVLLPVAGKPLLQHAMESLRMVSADVYAVLTDEDSRHELEPVCRAAGFQVFVGDPDDVLKRYIDAARHFEVSRILRATGDNPLVSFEIARASIRLAEEHNSDYAGYIHPPYGTAVEVFRTSALMQAHTQAKLPYEREHVTAYLYQHPEKFVISLEPAPEEWCGTGRVTVDTIDDLEYVRRMFSELYQGTPIAIQDVIKWCAMNPHSRLKVS